MAEGLKLENILNEEQLSVLTDCIKNSLENHLRIERENIEKLTTENAHIKATAERTEFRLGKELLEAESKYKQLSTSAQKLQSQVNELEGKLSKNESELKQANSSNNARLTELQIVKKKNEHLAAEKEDLVAQLDKRRNEADKLNGEIKNLTENLTSANEAKYETLAKIEEIQLHELNLEHRVKRLEQEKELLNEQIAALNEETVQKGQEIISLKREKSTFSLELQSELEQVQDELQITHNRINDLKKLLESKDERIEKLAQQLKDAKQAQIQQEEQYQIELHAQNKLLELYKKSSSDAQARVNELMRAVEEMHKLMNEANETNVQNEQKLNNCNMEWTKQLEEKGKEISQLQKELKDANDLLKTKGFSEEGLEKLFPTAAATSKVLHSGMTLTQIYSEYVKSQEDLQKEKTESHRLSQHLQQIVAEIEEKTPLVNQRFSEYQKALETISCLRNQLANSLTEQEVLQTERNDAKRVSTQLQNENQRLKQQLADVSQQVCVLLKEVEEARGGHISSYKSSQEELVSSSDETTANKVISKHLVTFRDIADLQEKNQQLLAVVRDLSQSQEEKETKAVEEKTCELHLKWEKTKSELQDLQKDKARQAEMLENIIRQRDMYRVLLSQYQGHSSIFTNTSLSPKQLTSTPVISRKDDFGLQETKSALSQLQKEFDVYRKEKIENLQMLNEQLDKLREEVSELRIRNTKLSSQLEYADERFNLLQSNSDMFKRETVSLREKNQKHTASITQHQLVINNLRQEVMSTQEKLSKAEVMAENLRAERDLLKNVEARLLQEKESLMREHQQQNRLVANLQAVQNNLERLESDTQHHLKNQIEKLEKECESLKSKLETEKEQYRSSAKIWEKHVQELQQKVDKEVERAHKTHDELVEAYAHIHELKQEATANAAKLAAAESQLSKMPSPGTGKPRGVLLEIKNLKDQLAEAHNENKTLQDRLNLAQKSVSHYRTLASDLEGQLKEQTQLSTHLKESMEKALKEREEMQVKVDKQSENYEKQCRQLIDENVVLMEESTKKVVIHNQEIDCLREKIQLLEEQAKNAMQNELKAREDCKEQAKLLEEAQEKYERELVLHSQDIQRLGSEKEKIESYHSQIQASEEKHHYLEQIIQEKEKSWEERESILKSELDSITQKYEDVSNTNNIVLNQIELLTSQMAAMQSKDWSSPVSSTESDNKSTQKLFEVIRYLRREKDISSAENEALKSETIRLKIKVDQLEKQSSELQKALSEEQTHAQTIASTEAKHAELLKKVEMLNVLRESNQLLRNEKDTLSQAQTDLENKVQQLEKQMNPMKELNVELSSQVDGLSAENIALRSEVKRWQARTNQLLEQSHKMGPEDYKRMSKENENLCKQVSALNEELHKKQAELSLVNSSVTAARKDLDTIKAEIAKEKSRTEALQKQLDEANNESAEKHKNLLQVKRIARKYKTQYDELLAKYNDLANKKNANESGSASSQETALSQQLRQDMEEKAKQYEEKTKLMSDEVEKMKEAMGKVTKDAEIIKSESMHKEERAKKLMLQARQRFSQLSTQKDLLAKEKDHLLKELEELKSKVALMEQVAEEDSQRTSSLKSHYESKLTMLEKEVNLSKENSEKMEKQIEELTQKINQQRQTSKPSTSAGPVDRLSVAAEPLTANIKPLAPPVQPSVTTLTMRHPPHSHTVTAVARTTPTASIRPIAIGTVSTSCTIASQTRMAAVLPTTAATTSSTPISDEEVRSIASPTSSQLSPALPQATVQPTPTIPTATVTSVVVIGDTPSAAIAPSSHAITSHEPTSTVICMSEPEETVTTQELPPVSTITPSLAPVTALVSPRVEVTDVSDQVEPSDTTASPSVIVSPSGFSSGTNITQTQVVVPTVKRQRDEDLLEHPATSLPQGKRIRMKSEGSQTTQQLTTEIQESGPSSINIAVVVSQPVTVESTVIEKPETPLASDLPPEQEKDQDHGSTSKLTSIQTETEEVLASTSSTNLKLPVDEEEVIIVESDDEKQKEESYDEQEDGEDFHEGEEMDDDDEEGDDEPQTDEYEDDNQMQEENYTQDDDDDDVMSAGPFEVEADMSQQTSDEVEIVVLDDGDDNQMDAQETTQVSNITTPANLAASEIVPPVANVGMPVSTETLAIPSIPPRTALLPRIPGRSERLPSMVRHQQLSFTIGAQGSGYEEGGDSIVPSTPTLFVPHRVDGFAEAVSSPHVPYDRFVFNSAADTSSSQQPLSQLATQGSLGVDDTRMDLSQFDDGSGRSVPTTPLQVSPPDITVTETPDSGSMDQQPIAVSPSTSSEPSAPTVIPMITITQESIDIPKQEQTEVSSEADSSVAQTVDDNAEIETDKKLVKVEQTESRFISQQTESQGPIIVEVTGASGEETSNESAVTGAIAEPSTFDMEQISGESEKGEASTSNNQAAQSRKPIIWDDPSGVDCAPRPSSPQQFSVPTSYPALRSQQQQQQQQQQLQQPPQSPSSPLRASRGRRIRLRGASTFSASRGPGNWGGRRGRGGLGRGAHMF